MNRTRIDSTSVRGLLKETVPVGECLFWTRAKSKNGYGHVKIGDKYKLVTRVIYQLSNDVCLSPSEVVCHECDNPPCINPKHLFSGTRSDNIQDAKRKGRMRTAQHGTRAMRVRGCSCRPCKDADALYARQRRKNKNK